LSARFAELAAVLDVRDLVDSTDPVVQVHAALAERTDRWLLLLDNVVDAESIRDVVPPAGNGHILLTTRSAHWPHALALEVPVLDRGVAAEFLSARTTDPDLAAAAKLADELGSLPLALEQAAAYLLATGGTVAGYIDRLRVNRGDTRSPSPPPGRWRSSGCRSAILPRSRCFDSWPATHRNRSPSVSSSSTVP
jgi:hypothetical protein